MTKLDLYDIMRTLDSSEATVRATKDVCDKASKALSKAQRNLENTQDFDARTRRALNEIRQQRS